VIFHSDRGCQYTSREFADFCAENGVQRSMGRRATCYDNAVSESFFATYKKELIHTRPTAHRVGIRVTNRPPPVAMWLIASREHSLESAT
jgi:transposase InsO family protein